MVKHEKSTLGWGAAGLVALGIFGSGNDNSPKQTSDSEKCAECSRGSYRIKNISTLIFKY